MSKCANSAFGDLEGSAPKQEKALGAEVTWNAGPILAAITTVFAFLC